MEYKFADQDPIQPTAIEHRCEELHHATTLEQHYNYLVYHFESEGAYFWARAYLDEISKVSLFGPLESRANRIPTGGVLSEPVLAYLRRRFRTVQTLQSDGYRAI
jgi:hypothetical protein